MACFITYDMNSDSKTENSDQNENIHPNDESISEQGVSSTSPRNSPSTYSTERKLDQFSFDNTCYVQAPALQVSTLND